MATAERLESSTKDMHSAMPMRTTIACTTTSDALIAAAFTRFVFEFWANEDPPV